MRLTRKTQFNCSDVAKRYATLSRREKQVVDMLVYGGDSTAKQIAKELDISHRTVEGYRAEALNKMGVSSSKELITRMIVCKLGVKAD